MQIIVDKKTAATVLGIHGHFNAAATPEFERVLKQCLDGGERRFVLNLAELTFISSTGLQSILSTAKAIKERNGNMVVCALQGEALKIFKISGFATLFSMYPTEAAALKQVDAAQPT